MSELGALQMPVAPRRRGVQRSLAFTVEGAPTATPDRPEGAARTKYRRPRKAVPAIPAVAKPDRSPPPPVFHPLAYRSIVAAWSIEARERWGRRSNELEEMGLSWRDAETQAFVEVWNQLRRAGGFSDPGDAG